MLCCGGSRAQEDSEEPAARPAQEPRAAGERNTPARARPSIEPRVSQQPPKKDPYDKNLWQQAFDNLDPGIQSVLQAHGFDGSGTPQGAKQSTDELIEKVNEKQEQVQERQWGFPYKGKKVVFREYTTDIVGWLTKAGDIAVQFSPPQAAVPWSVLKGLMNMAVVDAEQMAALFQVTERVVRVIDRGVVYESAYLRDEGADLSPEIAGPLEESLTAMFTTALNVLAETIYLLNKNTFMRGLASLFNERSVELSLQQIDMEEQKVCKDAGDCEAKRSKKADDKITGMLGKLNEPITRIDEGVQHLLQDVEGKEHLNMLEWISDIPYGRNHDNVRRHRTVGTGKWLLQHPDYITWESNSTSSMFWLQGSMGTGKTYLTSAVVDYTQHVVNEAAEVEGEIQHIRGEDQRRLPKEVFRSIVRQLSTTAQNPERTQTKLYELYKRCQEHKSKLGPEQYEEQILESLDIYPKTTIVIDALDEVRQAERDYLISRLTGFVAEAKGHVKIFVSSRPDPEIGHQLRHSPRTALVIAPDDNKKDIERFLNDAIDRLCETTPSPVFSKMRYEIIEKILARCDGMFQWATLLIQQISKCRVRSDVEEKLENFPNTLKELYERAWAQIEAVGGTHRLFVERAVLWLMAAEKPVTTEHLIAAVRVDPTGKDFLSRDEIDEGTLVMFCNDFLAVDQQQHVWRFAHPSVREFLEQRNGWYLPQAHFHAATACLNFFLKIPSWSENPIEQHKLSCDDDMRDSYFEIHGEGQPDRFHHPENTDITDVRNFFHIYARHHMFKHIQRAQENEAGTLASLLKTFLGSPNKSSAQYRKWYQWLTENLLSLSPEESQIASCEDADLNVLDLYQTGKGWTFNAEFGPPDAAIFSMCNFSLHDLLQDWWTSERNEIDVSRVNDKGHNLLTIAARSGCTPICRKIVERGLDVNAVNDIQNAQGGEAYTTALEAAAHQQHLDTVEYLLEAGALVKIDARHSQHGNALAAAIVAPASSATVVKALLVNLEERYVDVNSLIDHGRPRSPLATAASHGNLEVMDVLLKAGARPDTLLGGLGEKSATPLAYAVFFGHADVVRHLLDAGADPNARQPLFGDEATPLSVAFYAAQDLGRESCVELLVSRGADSGDKQANTRSIRDSVGALASSPGGVWWARQEENTQPVFLSPRYAGQAPEYLTVS